MNSKEQIRELGKLESRLNWIIDDIDNQRIIQSVCNQYTIRKIEKRYIYGKYIYWGIDGFSEQFDNLLDAILFCEREKK